MKGKNNGPTQARARHAGPALVLLVVLAGIGLWVAGSPARPIDGPNVARHVSSRVTTLVRTGPDDASSWSYQTVIRDIWIRPDGSGRILNAAVRDESTDNLLPVAAPSGQPLTEGDDSTFAPGELTYMTPAKVTDGLLAFDLRLGGPGDSLRRIASLLSETLPSADVSDLALNVGRGLGHVRIREDGDTVALSALTSDQAVEITLVFSRSEHRLLRDTWMSQVARPGLPLLPPYLTFQREVLVGESWNPADGW